jgi:hypothetical protein
MSLEVKVVVALEGGPLVVEVELTNQTQLSRGYNIRFATPDGIRWPDAWKKKPRMTNTRMGLVQGLEFKPAETHRRIIPAHWTFESIPSETLQTEVRIDFCDPGGDDRRKPLFTLARELKIRIEPRSRDSIRSTAEKLEKLLDRSPDDHAYELVAACILETNVTAFSPLALRVIDSHRPYAESLRSWLLDVLSRDEFIQVAIDQVSRSTPLAPDDWMFYVHFLSKRMPLSPTEHRRLRTAPNIWGQLAVFHYFPTAYSEDDVRSLLDRAGSVAAPLSKDRIEPLIDKLSSDRYAEREEAARSLLAFRESALPRLRSTLQGAKSADLVLQRS